MELERVRPAVLRVTLHAYELAALVAAARYMVDTAPDDVPTESLHQLAQLLADYDRQLRTLPAAVPPTG
ncbi:hypothetical protein GCM10010441_42510 [Kitasatospora paracochleata]|uniref:Imidazolonepropionase-like amidohydrolase n=1 Tax=Kitasatospora paracochleata TaxID=58354 RepID=A0ABT1J2J4_9ACTN|nr:hypothetical protein [Kitasatospora paracochleata]MCP2310961.1 imidazolonepropionase-like amidohydrolase [Kitasatospora paracochleata]